MRQSLVSIGFRVLAFFCIATISLHRESVRRAATAVDGGGPTMKQRRESGFGAWVKKKMIQNQGVAGPRNFVLDTNSCSPLSTTPSIHNVHF